MRKLGGLYVLGSERHESRRIDNQLRGRSGRQGDPGESRFYLSLDDELLRLFATGAMSWVMGRTLPDDVPIESKTVAKAIERAQNTVEARNAEMRKDDLKYDEVMDQQRKVIYERRLQIIDGDDLEEHTEDLLAGAAEKLVAEHCPTEFEEDWDLKGLVDGLTQYYPTKFTVGRSGAGGHDRGPGRVHRRGGARLLRAARASPCRAAPRRCARSSATSTCRSWTPAGGTTWPRWTTSRTASTCAGRSRPTPSTPGSRRATPCSASSWRSSTTTTCATSSTSRRCRSRRPSPTWTGPSTRRPRTPWPRPAPSPRCCAAEQGANVAPQATVLAAPALATATAVAAAPPERRRAQVKRPNAPDPDALVPIVKERHEKVGRNDPCWCGSGKKFKFCHGAA